MKAEKKQTKIELTEDSSSSDSDNNIEMSSEPKAIRTDQDLIEQSELKSYNQN